MYFSKFLCFFKYPRTRHFGPKTRSRRPEVRGQHLDTKQWFSFFFTWRCDVSEAARCASATRCKKNTAAHISPACGRARANGPNFPNSCPFTHGWRSSPAAQRRRFRRWTGGVELTNQTADHEGSRLEQKQNNPHYHQLFGAHVFNNSSRHREEKKTNIVLEGKKKVGRKRCIHVQ